MRYALKQEILFLFFDFGGFAAVVVVVVEMSEEQPHTINNVCVLYPLHLSKYKNKPPPLRPTLSNVWNC